MTARTAESLRAEQAFTQALVTMALDWPRLRPPKPISHPERLALGGAITLCRPRRRRFIFWRSHA